MDSVTINDSNMLQAGANSDKYKISKSKNIKNINKEKNSEKISDSTIFQNSDDAIISDDAKLSYKFLTRIEGSDKNDKKNSFIEKYTAEYDKIKKEIDSGKYGNDKAKYTALLDSTFKNALDKASKSLIETSTKMISTSNGSNGNNNIMKNASAQTLIQYQKQYSTANALTWICKAENKRIKEEMEYYKKRKNYQMVNSLKQLSHAYKRVIENCSAISTMIQNNIFGAFNSKQNNEVPQPSIDSTNESSSDQSSVSSSDVPDK